MDRAATWAWSPAHSQAVLDTLQKMFLGALVPQAGGHNYSPDVLKILRKIEHRGSLEIARRCCNV